MPQLVRVYAADGAKIAHLVPDVSFNNDRAVSNHASTCGRAYPRSSRRGWYGRYSINQMDHAAALPLCKLCARKLAD